MLILDLMTFVKGTVSWQLRLQKYVASSTTNVEYIVIISVIN